SHAQAAEHMNVAGTPISSYNKAECADSLIFRLTGLFGKLRLGSVHRTGCGNAAANVEDASSGTAAFTRAKAEAFARSDAASAARTDAAASACAVGRQYSVRHRITKVRHVVRC